MRAPRRRPLPAGGAGLRAASRRWPHPAFRVCAPCTIPSGPARPAARERRERTHADVAQTEEHRSATPGRPVRPGSSASQACGVTGARRAPTSSVRVRPLAGLLHTPVKRRGPERLGYLLVRAASAVRLRHRIPTAHHDRDVLPAAGRMVPVIDHSSTGRGFESRPRRSRLGSSVGRAVPGLTPRPQQFLSPHSAAGRSGTVIGRAPGRRREVGAFEPRPEPLAP